MIFSSIASCYGDNYILLFWDIFAHPRMSYNNILSEYRGNKAQNLNLSIRVCEGGLSDV